MNQIIQILMSRDELTRKEAEALLAELRERALSGEDPEELLYSELGLEPDYLFDLLDE